MISRFLSFLVLFVCLLATGRAQADLSEEQLAWHWDPETAEQARQATLALAIWLEDESADLNQWQDRVQAQSLALSQAFRQVPVDQGLLGDGQFGWLMQARDPTFRLGGPEQFMPPTEQLNDLLRPQRQAGRLARLHQLMAYQAPRIWSRLRARLNQPVGLELDGSDDEAEVQTEGSIRPGAEAVAENPVPRDIDGDIQRFWETILRPPPAPELSSAAPSVDPSVDHPETELARQEADRPGPGEGMQAEALADSEVAQDSASEVISAEDQNMPVLEPLPTPSTLALEQARRVQRWLTDDDPERARQTLVDLLQADLEATWERGDRLKAVWGLQQLIAQIAVLENPQEPASRLRLLLARYSEDPDQELRQIDRDLPVVLALLEDATIELERTPAQDKEAIRLLGDAYARLGLFMGDAEFYLDQPVRDEIRMAVSACTTDPDLVGPVPLAVFEDCLELLVSQMGDALGSVELVGDGDGPFSPLFLRREMGLSSWQRAAYLDGHLNWLLGASCRPPSWQNPLEWSLLATHLSHWVAQRPVFFDSLRWRDAVDAFEQQGTAFREASLLFIDCLSGLGSERLDPVLRLINRHARALDELEEALRDAQQAFYAEATRPQADIDLDSDAAQLTSYRPESLTIGPCPEANACGVRAELSVSRALLGEFPNAFLLADQLLLGQLGLCYQDVRWVDRQARPHRSNDPRVANYEAYLSFDLLGTFEHEGETEVVFRQRLRSAEPRHYLFAASDPEVLAMDCPNALAGQPIASQLAEGHLGLVPDRLTYFVSQPTTAEAELLANWDEGAEWRDWFVTGDRVDKVTVNDGAVLAIEVEAEIDRLANERERQIAGRLLSRLSPTDLAPDPLSTAMAAVAENTALMRRVLELHYPRVIRHEQGIRSALTGEAGLLDRDRVRQLADLGVPLAASASTGRERLEDFRARWISLPLELRESGQLSPELDFAAERLSQLRLLSRRGAVRAESWPDP